MGKGHVGQKSANGESSCLTLWLGTAQFVRLWAELEETPLKRRALGWGERPRAARLARCAARSQNQAASSAPLRLVWRFGGRCVAQWFGGVCLPVRARDSNPKDPNQ